MPIITICAKDRACRIRIGGDETKQRAATDPGGRPFGSGTSFANQRGSAGPLSRKRHGMLERGSLALRRAKQGDDFIGFL